jgi:capsular polysaccharide biosynthesis protein
MEETISIQELFAVLKKRIGMIITLGILGVIMAAGVTTFVIKPHYQSTASLVAVSSDKKEATQQNDLNNNILLINTYKDLIKSNYVLDQVSKKLNTDNGLHYSEQQLNGMLVVTQNKSSQMFTITATAGSAKDAQLVVNTTAKEFQESAGKVLQVDKVTIASEGKENLTPTSPNKKLNIVIGFVVGMMLAVALAFLLEFLDKTVKDQRFITEELGLPIIGEISTITKSDVESTTGKLLGSVEETGIHGVNSSENENHPTRRERAKV